MTATSEPAQAASNAPADWQQHAGKGVVVFAFPGSYAARQAAGVVREAEALLESLRTLLAVPTSAEDPLVIYLVESIAQRGNGLFNGATSPENGSPAAPQDGKALLHFVQPEATGEPLAVPLTRRMAARWFGENAAGADTFIAGLAGLASAAAGLGPSAADADGWVQSELEAGHSVSLAPPASPAQKAAAPLGDNRAATSFVSFLQDSHGAAAMGKYLTEYDPARRDQAAVDAFRQPMGALEEAWLANLRRPPSQAGATPLLARFLPLLRPYRRQRLEILILLIVAAALNLVPSLAVKWIVDRLTDYQKQFAGTHLDRVQEFTAHTLIPFVLFLLAYYVLDAIVSLYRSYAVARLNQNILNNLQEQMFAHLQSLSHSFYGRFKVGDIMERLTGDLQSVQQALSQVANKGLYQAFNLVAVVIALIWLSHKSPWLIAGELLFVPLFAVAFFALRRHNKDASREQRRRVAETATYVQENLSAQDVVKAMALEQRAKEDYGKRIQRQTKSALRLALLGGLSDLSEDTILGLAQLMVYGVGGFLVVQSLSHPSSHGMSIGDLSGLTKLLGQLFGPIAALSAVLQNLQQATGSIDRVNELLDEPVSIAQKPDAVPLPPLTQEIRLEDVMFGYGGERPILRGLTLTIPAGANVAFVGPSGCGKSTMLRLLTRFWDPEGGRVLFDGLDLRDVTLSSLRGQIGLVFQDTFIFDTTVMENIRLARPEATDADVVHAAQQACLDADICDESRFAKGYDTVLGERGGRMSGGQRQRLAIARALLRNPRILLFDEATSALDAHTEAEILDTLAGLTKGRTTISITHRLSWAAKADLIFVLDKGQVVEQGPHAQLVKAGGLYQKLYEEQSGYISAGQAPGAVTFAVVKDYVASVVAVRLQAVPLFSGLDDKALALLAQKIRWEEFVPGADIVAQGEPGDKVYIIGKGEVEVLVAAGDQERRVATLDDADYFGEMGLLTGEPRSATVRALRPTQVYSLSRLDFLSLLQREPALREAVSQTVAGRQAALAALPQKTPAA